MAKIMSKQALEKRTKSQSNQIAKLKENAKKAPMSSAAATIGGAAALGAYKAKVGDSIMGAPVEPVGAVAVSIAGFAMGRPALISFAAGWLAPYVADQIEQSLS